MEMTTNEGKQASYSPTPERGAHIASQRFAFQGREQEAARVIENWDKRREFRASDEIRNPLVAVSGSRGAGRSVFLVHFPCFPVFTASFSNPIVCTMTFTQRMRCFGEKNLFGLRIIYGTLKAMVGLPEHNLFTGFVKDFEEVKEISATSAIEILWYLFGYRPFILLVDELARASEDSDVFNEIGLLLDMFAEVYVLVSSRSPAYIENLASKRGRAVAHIPLEPMFYSPLGAHEGHVWAAQFSTEQSSSGLLLPMLQNVHLLASGHPLTLDKLASRWMIWDANSDQHKTLQKILQLPRHELPALKLLKDLSRLVANTSRLPPLFRETMELILQSRPLIMASYFARLWKVLKYRLGEVAAIGPWRWLPH